MNQEIKYAMISNIVSWYAMMTCFDKRKHIIVKIVATIISITFMIAVIVTLTGCTTRPLQVTAPCPRPNLPAEPHYPLQDLKQGDDKATVAKAWVASFQRCYDYSHQLRYVCGGYE